MTIIPALRRLRQEDDEFETIWKQKQTEPHWIVHLLQFTSPRLSDRYVPMCLLQRTFSTWSHFPPSFSSLPCPWHIARATWLVWNWIFRTCCGNEEKWCDQRSGAIATWESRGRKSLGNGPLPWVGVITKREECWPVYPWQWCSWERKGEKVHMTMVKQNIGDRHACPALSQVPKHPALSAACYHPEELPWPPGPRGIATSQSKW